MMRVTIEILPYGREDQKYLIQTIDIWNTGKRNKHGKYRYEFSDSSNPDNSDGMLYHDRDRGAAALAARVLNRYTNARRAYHQHMVDVLVDSQDV